MVIKKRTFYIVLPILILVILISFILIYLMGWVGNTPKLNSYQSLTEICTVERKLFNIDIKCDALIYESEERDGQNCLDLRVINKENTNILPLEVCESNKVLDISDPVLDTDMKVPMHMVFEYTYLPLLSYGISDISMELMEDKEISDVLYKLYQDEINIQNIRFQERVDIEEKGYYYTESEKIVEGMTIGIITFVHTKVNKISIENEEIILDLSISINGVMRETQIRVREFEYLTNRLPSEPKVINISSISEIDITKSHDLRFLYIPKEIEVNIETLNKYCSGGKVVLKSLCDNKENLETYTLDKPIEDYIKTSFEKLMFSTFFANE